MRNALPTPTAKTLLFENDRVYACLATHPLTRGHVVVVWKDNVPDLHRLTRREYEHLMDIVNAVRTAMLHALGITKVYLLYMDEVRHVHWHVVPRYNERGYDIFSHAPKKAADFSLAPTIRRLLNT